MTKKILRMLEADRLARAGLLIHGTESIRLRIHTESWGVEKKSDPIEMNYGGGDRDCTQRKIV